MMLCIRAAAKCEQRRGPSYFGALTAAVLALELKRIDHKGRLRRAIRSSKQGQALETMMRCLPAAAAPKAKELYISYKTKTASKLF